MRSADPAVVLREALTHLLVVVDYGRGDTADQKSIDAICMRLSAGIESLAGLDPALRQELFGETWPDMWLFAVERGRVVTQGGPCPC